jgi:hypothetical protein
MEFQSNDESSPRDLSNHGNCTPSGDLDELFDVELLRAAMDRLLEEDASLPPFRPRPWNRARYRHPQT